MKYMQDTQLKMRLCAVCTSKAFAKSFHTSATDRRLSKAKETKLHALAITDMQLRKKN
jgi:hypothetical protein